MTGGVTVWTTLNKSPQGNMYMQYKWILASSFRGEDFLKITFFPCWKPINRAVSDLRSPAKLPFWIGWTWFAPVLVATRRTTFTHNLTAVHLPVSEEIWKMWKVGHKAEETRSVQNVITLSMVQPSNHITTTIINLHSSTCTKTC